MDLINLSLDGRMISAPAGSNLLEVVRANGVDLPSLCHDPRLNPFGACRLCLVEIEGAGRPVTACTTTVSEGLVVRTDTENLNRLRRLALELLLSNHYGDCQGPCQGACPAGIDIQGFIALIGCGEYAEALKLIKEVMPLPAVCGRVCPRFCEEACRRNLVDEPVAICSLKRFAADVDLAAGGTAYRPPVKPRTGKKVAVVGGGPAGLTAAYFLAVEGHDVVIFEAAPALGGMLRYGIPAYRLPKDILDREIELITGLCAGVHLDSALGRDFTVADLQAAGYAAVFVALGAQASQGLGLPGEDLPGVLGGVDFLRQAAAGEPPAVGRRVAVVGGGNTAMDAARTALRLGAEEVTVLYRRSRQEMPARDEEVTEAAEEGIKFNFLVNPARLVEQNGRLAAVECQQTALGEPDSSGRRRPQPVPGSEFSLAVDTLIMAVGQKLDRSALANSPVPLKDNGYLEADPETGATPVPGVFSGGDCVTGPATVVEAIAAGRRAALAIAGYLEHGRVVPVSKPYNCTRGELTEIDPQEYADRERIARTPQTIAAAEQRKTSFQEYAEGFSPAMAEREAGRCLACGCQEGFACELRRLATKYRVDDKRFGRGSMKHQTHDDHRYILRDANKCVLCGSCVRICAEAHGISALGFAFRGHHTVVQPALNLPLAETLCDSCGQCISACPTGALSARVFLPRSGPWQTTAVPSVCTSCSVGCPVELHVIGNKLVKVTSPVGNPVNNGNLCQQGAFGHAWINSNQRPAKPLWREGGQMTEVSWDQALTAAARILLDIKRSQGPERLAVLVSPRLSVEENYLAQKLARLALETDNLASLAPEVPGAPSGATFADLDTADLIMVVGADLHMTHPIVAQRISQAVAKGRSLLLINTRSTRLDPQARMTIETNRRRIQLLLETMLKYILDYDLMDDHALQKDDDLIETLRRQLMFSTMDKAEHAVRVKFGKVVDFIHLYLRAKNPVIVTDPALGQVEITLLDQLAQLAGNRRQPGGGLLVLQPQVKTLPQQPSPSLPPVVDGLVLLTAGEEVDLTAFFSQRPFTVLLTPVLNGSRTQADIILPGASFAETAGTFINAEGRRQVLRPALAPPGGKQNWRVITDLLTALGHQQPHGSPEAILAEMFSLAAINS